MPLSSKAQLKFKKSFDAKCLNLADTFGGKICAALDRQHPRDLFDVKNLLENEGITEEVKNSFLFYLLSHARPLDELLNPRFKDIENNYHDNFVGMAEQEPSLEELINVRKDLIPAIIKSLSNSDKEFLVTFASRDPDWSKIIIPEIEKYPSIQWKLFNQNKMTKEKVGQYVQKVRQVLGL
jgi:predicted nucleotidyltransferase component of viral defense system